MDDSLDPNGGVFGACTPDPTTNFSRREVLAATTAAAVAATFTVPTAQATQVPAATSASPTPSKTAQPITLTINTHQHTLTLEPRTSLLDALREHLNLAGTKKGCDHGQCGACTVLINDERRLSCLTLACMHQSDKVTTVEGLAKGDQEGGLHPLQQAFIDHDAFQCGYCTPGQLCSAAALLKEGHAKTDAEIREQMSGNLCRCGAYPNILAAIKQVMATA